MIVIPAKSKIAFTGMVELYGFPAEKIKTYQDYLSLGKTHLLRTNNARKIAVHYQRSNNRVVDLGLGFIRDFLLQEGPAASPVGPNTNSVGSGTNAPAAGDTGLQTQIQRIAITEYYASGLAAKFDTFWPSPDGIGTWNETALHNHISNANSIYCRKTFLSPFGKTNALTALIAWTLTSVAV